MKRLLTIFILVSTCCACGSECREGELVKDVQIDMDIKRLDQQLFELNSRHEVAQFLNEHELFAKQFLRIDEYPHDSIVINDLYALITDPKIDSLHDVVEVEFGNMKGIGNELERLFKHVKYYYPEYSVPQIYTVVTGFGSDFFANNEIMVIGLDYYLRIKRKYQPELPVYMLKRYQPEYILPSVATVISGAFNATDPRDQTLMADMVYYGKSLYFMEKMIPCIADTLLLGYSAEQVKFAEEGQELIWAHFLERDLLFDPSPMASSKYTGERPYVGEIGPKVPGRIGRWLGYKIVKKYMHDHPNVTLQQLMANSDAQMIFSASKYKPS